MSEELVAKAMLKWDEALAEAQKMVERDAASAGESLDWSKRSETNVNKVMLVNLSMARNLTREMANSMVSCNLAQALDAYTTARVGLKDMAGSALSPDLRRQAIAMHGLITSILRESLQDCGCRNGKYPPANPDPNLKFFGR